MGIFDALNTALSGLQAQSFALQNISGNVANSQTTGYKETDTCFQDLLAAAALGQQTANGVTAISPPLANRQWPRRRCGAIVVVVWGEKRLERFLRPKFRRADLFQTGGVPVKPGGRQRPSSLHRFRDGIDIGRFRVDVQRRRIVLHQGDDPLGVRPRPTGAAVAAAPGIILKLPERNVSVFVRVGAVRIFSKTDIP